MKKLLFLFVLAAQSLFAQTAPSIGQTLISISQGKVAGFVMDINADTSVIIQEWKALANMKFPPVKSGESVFQIPETIKTGVKGIEYKTTGIHIPHLSQRTVDVYVKLNPIFDGGTRVSLAVDLGRGVFLDIENVGASNAVKHLMNQLFVAVDEMVHGER